MTTKPINKKDFIIELYAINSVNKVYNEVAPKIINTLKPYLNNYLKNVNEKLQKELKEIKNKNFKEIENNLKPLTIKQTNTNKNFISLSYDLLITKYNINLRIEINLNGGCYDDNTLYYHNQTIAFKIGDIKNNQLIKLYQFKKQKILNINKEYDNYLKIYNKKIKLEKQLNKIKPSIYQEFIKESFKNFYVK